MGVVGCVWKIPFITVIVIKDVFMLHGPLPNSEWNQLWIEQEQKPLICLKIDFFKKNTTD